jgi:hypothetical protein
MEEGRGKQRWIEIKSFQPPRLGGDRDGGGREGMNMEVMGPKGGTGLGGGGDDPAMCPK